MPKHWGIIIAKSDSENIKFTYARRATLNQNFDKETALHTLWKSELLDSEEAKIVKRAKNLNREQLANLIAASLSEGALLKFISDKLSTRSINPGSL